MRQDASADEGTEFERSKALRSTAAQDDAKFNQRDIKTAISILRWRQLGRPSKANLPQHRQLDFHNKQHSFNTSMCLNKKLSLI